MENYSIVLLTLINFCRVIINIQFIENFFDKKSCSNILKVIAGIFFGSITITGYFLWQRLEINIITNIICLFSVTLLYAGTLKKKIILSLSIYFTNMVCDVIAVYIIFAKYNQDGYMLGQSACSVLLIGICEIFIRKFLFLKSTTSYIGSHWRVLLAVPICSIFIIHVGLVSNMHIEQLIGIQCIGLLLINIFSFYLYTTMENAFFENVEKEIYIQASKHYVDQVNLITYTQEEIRSLQHDLKYHLRELAVMAKKSNVDDMLRYLENLQKLATNSNEIVFSGNVEIDGNLNYYLNLAQEKLLDVKIDLAVPEKAFESAHDINIIIANLLDNAIVAAEMSEKKELIFNMKFDRTLLYISVVNSYLGTIVTENKYFRTSKKNKQLHGYGLKNVEKIVNKYNGVLDISYEEDTFTVNVMLYVNV